MRLSFRSAARLSAPSLVFAAVLATVPVVAATSHHASPASTAVAGYEIQGVTVDKVLFRGKVVPVSAYRHVVAAAPNHGTGLGVVIDKSAIARGYVVAFESDAATNAYMSQHHLGKLPSTALESHVSALTGPHKGSETTLGSDRVSMVTCSLPYKHAEMYETSYCGGSYLAVSWNDAIPAMSTYGWDNRVSSIGIGTCISNMTTWNSNSYTGARASFGGGTVYSVLAPQGGSNINDSISSVKTDYSGAC